MISTHAPEADQIGAGVLQRPKNSRYGWSENGEGLKHRPEHFIWSRGWGKTSMNALYLLPRNTIECQS